MARWVASEQGDDAAERVASSQGMSGRDEREEGGSKWGVEARRRDFAMRDIFCCQELQGRRRRAALTYHSLDRLVGASASKQLESRENR